MKGSQLADGEQIILNLRSHWKTLIPAIIVAAVLVAIPTVASYLSYGHEYGSWISLGTTLVALIIGVRYVLIPIWRWTTSRFVVTNRKVSQRSGLLTKVSRDIPLHRVNDLAVTRTPVNRILGCGNLLISDATEKAGMEVIDVPRVESVQVQIQNLLYRYDDGSDDGEWPPNEPPRPRGR